MLGRTLLPSFLRGIRREIWIGIGFISITAFIKVALKETKRRLTRPIRGTIGLLLTGGGFLKNVVTELAWNHKDYTDDGGKYDKIFMCFYEYLVETQIFSEMIDAFDENFLLNATILMKAQPSRIEQTGTTKDGAVVSTLQEAKRRLRPRNYRCNPS